MQGVSHWVRGSQGSKGQGSKGQIRTNCRQRSCSKVVCALKALPCKLLPQVSFQDGVSCCCCPGNHAAADKSGYPSQKAPPHQCIPAQAAAARMPAESDGSQTRCLLPQPRQDAAQRSCVAPSQLYIQLWVLRLRLWPSCDLWSAALLTLAPCAYAAEDAADEEQQ